MDNTEDMRTTYTNTLIELAAVDERIVILEADLMYASSTTAFKARFPERTFNIGVAEANMAGVAAGLSSTGKIPFATSFGSFAGRKTYDQFFISANYARLNVKLVGLDPGVTAAYNGGTHMAMEDGGIMRNIPGLTVFEPSDNASLRILLGQCARQYGCAYMRLHRKGHSCIHAADAPLELGKGVVLRDGDDITLIATGFLMVPEAMKAAALLAERGISAAVIDMHTVKPIDRALIAQYALKTGAIVTCENHQVINFLGSAVAEVLAEEQPIPMARIGIQDEFGEVGDLAYLVKRFHLGAADIAETAHSVLKRKQQ
jgi:transketolase